MSLFYTADLSRNEEFSRDPDHVENYLVELCEEHGGVNCREIDRQGSATATAIKAMENRYTQYRREDLSKMIG